MWGRDRTGVVEHSSNGVKPPNWLGVKDKIESKKKNMI